jgi:hypothetical protein
VQEFAPPGVTRAVFANKWDVDESERRVQLSDVERFAREKAGAIFFITSAKLGTNVGEAIDTVAIEAFRRLVREWREQRPSSSAGGATATAPGVVDVSPAARSQAAGGDGSSNCC